MNTLFLHTSDGEIAYDDTGSGPLVICVPGMGDVRSQYRFLAPQLVAEGFRVVTMDNRGHGESSVDWKDYSVAAVGSDILALIRHLNAGPAIIIGQSMAAGGAVWASVEGPALVRGLALIDPAVHGEPGSSMRMIMKVLFARPWGPAAWLWYYKMLYPARKPADWTEYTGALRRNLTQHGRIEALQQMMNSSQMAAGERLEKVCVPAFIVMGSKDPDFKPDAETEAKWVASRLRGSYRMIEGAGHYPHVEMPEITNPQIITFLKTFQSEEIHAPAAR